MWHGKCWALLTKFGNLWLSCKPPKGFTKKKSITSLSCIPNFHPPLLLISPFTSSMKTSHIVAATVGTIAIASIGCALYFDAKRRSDPNFRRKLSMSILAIACIVGTLRSILYPFFSLECYYNLFRRVVLILGIEVRTII